MQPLSADEAQRLYEDKEEAETVLSEQRLVEQIVGAEPGLVLRRTWKLSLLGTPASIYVIDKRAAG